MPCRAPLILANLANQHVLTFTMSYTILSWFRHRISTRGPAFGVVGPLNAELQGNKPPKFPGAFSTPGTADPPYYGAKRHATSESQSRPNVIVLGCITSNPEAEATFATSARIVPPNPVVLIDFRWQSTAINCHSGRTGNEIARL